MHTMRCKLSCLYCLLWNLFATTTTLFDVCNLGCSSRHYFCQPGINPFYDRTSSNERLKQMNHQIIDAERLESVSPEAPFSHPCRAVPVWSCLVGTV